MLDNTKFSITFEEIAQLKNVLLLFSNIHGLSDAHFYITGHSNSKKVNINSCHELTKSNVEHYPLDVILPLIEYKVLKLDQIDDPYKGYDGSSIKAYLIELESDKLSIKRTYLYAGK